MQQLPLGVSIPDRATFASFHSGPNQMAVERLRSLTFGDRGVIWLWGADGSGRSHLLQAACASAGTRRAAYLPLRELGEAATSFLGDVRLLDLLCIDDIGCLIGQRDFELALFSAYRSLEERGGGLIVAADQAPIGLSWVLADIRSRFGAAEIFQLKPLDEEGEREALRLRAASRGLDLPEETARYLLRRFPRDMTTLGRLLDEIDLASLSAQRRLTVPFVKSILGES
ncbi:MAG: DnaA regulatory inactivator Hda [Steroidobacteraceae bacterium]